MHGRKSAAYSTGGAGGMGSKPKTFAEETNAPRGAAWMDEKSEEEEGSEQQRAGCYQKAWIYPELPWGAPPSWNENHLFSSKFLAIWECLTCMACLYIAFIVPYLAGFDDHKAEQYALFKRCGIKYAGQDVYGTLFALIDLTCDVMFVVDLILNFHIAYWKIDNRGREHWVLVDDLKTIRSQYLRTNFLTDLVGVLPWQYLDCAELPTNFKILRLFRLLKLFRLYRLRRAIKLIYFKYPRSVFFFTGIELFVSMFLVAHWLCCAWFYVGVKTKGWVVAQHIMDENGEFVSDDLLYQWVTSIYWAITTMTTIGYGDISATTEQERELACLVMVIGCAFFAWSTGKITQMLTDQKRCQIRFRDKLDELSGFVKARDLPEELVQQIKSFYMLKFPAMRIFDEDAIFADLPSGLSKAVKVELFKDIVLQCPLFHAVERSIAIEICSCLKQVYVTGDVEITSEGEIADAMYIVRFGLVGLWVHGQEISVARRGDLFGENALLGLTLTGRRTRTSISKTLCELCKLQREDFYGLLENKSFRKSLEIFVTTHINSLQYCIDCKIPISLEKSLCIGWKDIIERLSASPQSHARNQITSAKSSEETNAARKPGVSVSLKSKSVFRGVLRRNYDHLSTISRTGSHPGSQFLKTQVTIIFETLSVPEEVLTGIDISVDQLIIIAAIGGLEGYLDPCIVAAEKSTRLVPHEGNGD
uniref:Cyclic nucleotide-binding domain-containing protein n=1 Tax=Guillardia theta TaxID=55529 RepID=A0A7S4PDA0_GUITH|mmetsp:Transcript_4864/g.17664  ORF Transcript_4864/g.17664 Transcript_4864/m.17664 type:complete len:703 (+) Transcript_4864:71-2179(+)